MGLDITAISKVHDIGSHVPKGNYCDEEDGEHNFAFVYDGMEHSLRGLTAGHCYVETERTEGHGFRAGSYGGYGVFREHVAALVGRFPADYWGSGQYNGKVDEPFYEFINFADNEGTIGSEAAADLLEDFRQHRALFEKRHPDWLEAYDDWIRAFELAADNGMVVFH